MSGRATVLETLVDLPGPLWLLSATLGALLVAVLLAPLALAVLSASHLLTLTALLLTLTALLLVAFLLLTLTTLLPASLLVAVLLLGPAPLTPVATLLVASLPTVLASLLCAPSLVTLLASPLPLALLGSPLLWLPSPSLTPVLPGAGLLGPAPAVDRGLRLTLLLVTALLLDALLLVTALLLDALLIPALSFLLLVTAPGARGSRPVPPLCLLALLRPAALLGPASLL